MRLVGLPGWLRSACVCLFAVALLAYAAREPALIGDVARDFLIARDCVEVGQCHTVGAKALFPGIFQGALWIHFVVLVELLGGGPRAVQAVVIALQALSVGLLHWLVVRWIDRRAALPAALLVLAVVLRLQDHSVLWNHSLPILAAVVSNAALFQLVHTGRVAMAFAAGTWLAVGTTLHVSSGMLLPALLVLSLLAGRWPLSCATVALVAYALCFAATSYQAVVENLGWLVDTGVWIPVLLFHVSSAGAAVQARRWFALRTHAERSLVLLTVLLAAPAVGLVILSFMGRAPFANYFYPVLPAAAAGAGWSVAKLASALLGRSRQAWARSAIEMAPSIVIGVVVLVPSADAGSKDLGPTWYPSEVAVIGPPLHQRHSYAELKQVLQGPDCSTLKAALAVQAPPPRSLGDGRETAPLVLRLAPQLAPKPQHFDGQLLATADGQRFLIREIATWLDWRYASVCHEPRASKAICQPLGMDPREDPTDPRFRYAARAYPSAHEPTRHSDYHVRYVLGLKPRGQDTLRVLRVLDTGKTCRWTIRQVQGLAYLERLPAESVTLVAARDVDEGRVVFARNFGTACVGSSADTADMPCVVEMRPHERKWLDRAIDTALER